MRAVFSARSMWRAIQKSSLAVRQSMRFPRWAAHQVATTQVSFVPPPCDEFTTSDPSRSATRVSPPGTRLTVLPDST